MARKINFFEQLLGSWFYTGYLPVASGTFGSLAALGIYLIPGFENPVIMLSFISIFTIAGINLGTKFEQKYGKDPAECTIDEAVGTWISLILVPKQIWIIIIAFLIWRLMDILKPFPARQLEKLKGGKGIMLDDIVSGFYSLILIQILLHFIY